MINVFTRASVVGQCCAMHFPRAVSFRFVLDFLSKRIWLLIMDFSCESAKFRRDFQVTFGGGNNLDWKMQCLLWDLRVQVDDTCVIRSNECFSSYLVGFLFR